MVDCRCRAHTRHDHDVVLVSTLCGQGPVVLSQVEGGSHGTRQAWRMCGESLLHFLREALGLVV
jgi:hypothetical protein